MGRCLKQPVTGVAVLVAEAKAVAGPEQHLLSAVGAAGAEELGGSVAELSGAHVHGVSCADHRGAGAQRAGKGGTAHHAVADEGLTCLTWVNEHGLVGGEGHVVLAGESRATAYPAGCTCAWLVGPELDPATGAVRVKNAVCGAGAIGAVEQADGGHLVEGLVANDHEAGTSQVGGKAVGGVEAAVGRSAADVGVGGDGEGLVDGTGDREAMAVAITGGDFDAVARSCVEGSGTRGEVDVFGGADDQALHVVDLTAKHGFLDEGHRVGFAFAGLDVYHLEALDFGVVGDIGESIAIGVEFDTDLEEAAHRSTGQQAADVGDANGFGEAVSIRGDAHQSTEVGEGDFTPAAGRLCQVSNAADAEGGVSQATKHAAELDFKDAIGIRHEAEGVVGTTGGRHAERILKEVAIHVVVRVLGVAVAAVEGIVGAPLGEALSADEAFDEVVAVVGFTGLDGSSQLVVAGGAVGRVGWGTGKISSAVEVGDGDITSRLGLFDHVAAWFETGEGVATIGGGDDISLGADEVWIVNGVSGGVEETQGDFVDDDVAIAIVVVVRVDATADGGGADEACIP